MAFYTKELFQKDIQALVLKHNVSHLEAMMMFVKEKNIDVEDLIPLLTPFLKNKLLVNGMEVGILKKEPSVDGLF